jgi:hypothetical protein
LTLLACLSSAACFHNTALEAGATGSAGGSGNDGAAPGHDGAAGSSSLDGAEESVALSDGGSGPVALSDGGSGPDGNVFDPRPHKRIAFNAAGGRNESFAFNGNLGGLAGADAKCQAGADYERLGGTWIAWLSDSTTNALDRIASDGPWYTLDGHLAFAHKAELAGAARASIEIDQAGSVVAASSYWTGTRTGGTKGDATCRDWTSSNDADEGIWGNGRSADQWTETKHPAGCLGAVNLLCIEL